MSTFEDVRDVAVAVGRSATVLSVKQIDTAIHEADRAMGLGPFLDPTAFMRGSDSLREQIAYLRAFRDFRAAIEAFRSSEDAA